MADLKDYFLWSVQLLFQFLHTRFTRFGGKKNSFMKVLIRVCSTGKLFILARALFLQPTKSVSRFPFFFSETLQHPFLKGKERKMLSCLLLLSPFLYRVFFSINILRGLGFGTPCRVIIETIILAATIAVEPEQNPFFAREANLPDCKREERAIKWLHPS